MNVKNHYQKDSIFQVETSTTVTILENGIAMIAFQMKECLFPKKPKSNLISEDMQFVKRHYNK